MSGRIRIRRATHADLPAIDRLERLCFGAPWLEDVYAQELERDVGLVEVAEDEANRAVVGLSCSWLVAEEAHLMRLATEPRLRRQGIGRRLLESAVHEATRANCAWLFLEVAAANTAALALYQGLEFEVIGRRVGYYSQPPDDAIVMRRPLRARAPFDSGRSCLD